MFVQYFAHVVQVIIITPSLCLEVLVHTIYVRDKLSMSVNIKVYVIDNFIFRKVVPEVESLRCLIVM